MSSSQDSHSLLTDKILSSNWSLITAVTTGKTTVGNLSSQSGFVQEVVAYI